MKAEEIAQALRERLPIINNSFTTSVVVNVLDNPVNDVALATTATDHNLSVGDSVLIKGAQSNIPITSLTRNGILGTLITDRDHDTTQGLMTIDLDGSNEAEFNGNFKIHRVRNRRTIDFVMEDTGATVATGSPLLVDGESVFRGYNGTVIVTLAPSATQFMYDLPNGAQGLQIATGSITVESGIRISAAGTLERIVAAYTKQETTENWLFAVLGDVQASKSREIQSDGVDNQQRNQQGDNFRQQIIQAVTLYAFIPTSDKLTARAARDECEDLFSDICRSVLFKKFGNGLTGQGNGSLAFVSHGTQGYNSAYYVHQYSFEQMADLTFSDTVGYDDDVAFRNVEFSDYKISTGNEKLIAAIDLDEEQL